MSLIEQIIFNEIDNASLYQELCKPHIFLISDGGLGKDLASPKDPKLREIVPKLFKSHMEQDKRVIDNINYEAALSLASLYHQGEVNGKSDYWKAAICYALAVRCGDRGAFTSLTGLYFTGGRRLKKDQTFAERVQDKIQFKEVPPEDSSAERKSSSHCENSSSLIECLDEPFNVFEYNEEKQLNRLELEQIRIKAFREKYINEEAHKKIFSLLQQAGAVTRLNDDNRFSIDKISECRKEIIRSKSEADIGKIDHKVKFLVNALSDYAMGVLNVDAQECCERRNMRAKYRQLSRKYHPDIAARKIENNDMLKISSTIFTYCDEAWKIINDVYKPIYKLSDLIKVLNADHDKLIVITNRLQNEDLNQDLYQEIQNNLESCDEDRNTINSKLASFSAQGYLKIGDPEGGSNILRPSYKTIDILKDKLDDFSESLKMLDEVKRQAFQIEEKLEELQQGSEDKIAKLNENFNTAIDSYTKMRYLFHKKAAQRIELTDPEKRAEFQQINAQQQACSQQRYKEMLNWIIDKRNLTLADHLQGNIIAKKLRKVGLFKSNLVRKLDKVLKAHDVKVINSRSKMVNRI